MKMEMSLDQIMDQEEIFPETQPFSTEGEFYLDDLVTELDIELPIAVPEEVQPSKRKKSYVWNHFHIVDDGEVNKKAICNHCNKSYSYQMGTRINGTSHLKRHIEKGACKAHLTNESPAEAHLTNAKAHLTNESPAVSSVKPRRPRRRSRATKVLPAAVSYDADRYRKDFLRMIIMHDYPLHIGEQPGFVTFAQNLQPQLDIVSFNDVEGDCLATYAQEKQEIHKVIDSMPGRICLSLEIQLSSRTTGYVFVTGQFIDCSGKIQRKLMNVIMDQFPDSDFALSHAVAACLSDWGMVGKLFSVTVNRQLNNAAANNVRALLSVQSLKGHLLVGNCLAHALGSAVQTALSLTSSLVMKVRDCIKYVKSSESHEEDFIAMKQQLQVPSSKILSIDDQSRWNTTYEMLIAASELKLVFYCMDTSDPDYNGNISAADWKQIDILCYYLKLLLDMANHLTMQTSQTSNTFFHEACAIVGKLVGAATSEDPFTIALAKSLREQFEKYWNSCWYVLAIAAVMDPRFKMRIVEFSFSRLYGEEAAAQYVNNINEGIIELFREYATDLPMSSSPATVTEANGNNQDASHLGEFDAYLEESNSRQDPRSELDQYLEENLYPRVHDFDVIGWWNENRIRYPTISRMAYDILSIPVSTVSGSSVFDTEAKKMDSHRCDLRPETVQAIFCAKDWLQSEKADEVETPDAALVKMKEQETV